MIGPKTLTFGVIHTVAFVVMVFLCISRPPLPLVFWTVLILCKPISRTRLLKSNSLLWSLFVSITTWYFLWSGSVRAYWTGCFLTGWLARILASTLLLDADGQLRLAGAFLLLFLLSLRVGISWLFLLPPSLLSLLFVGIFNSNVTGNVAIRLSVLVPLSHVKGVSLSHATGDGSTHGGY